MILRKSCKSNKGKTFLGVRIHSFQILGFSTRIFCYENRNYPISNTFSLFTFSTHTHTPSYPLGKDIVLLSGYALQNLKLSNSECYTLNFDWSIHKAQTSHGQENYITIIYFCLHLWFVFFVHKQRTWFTSRAAVTLTTASAVPPNYDWLIKTRSRLVNMK